VITVDAAAMSYAVQRQTSGEQELLAGTIVIVDNANAVRPARQNESSQVLGSVAALPKDLASPGTVEVVSSGIVSVLVSDLGGDVTVGDQITVSPIQGVGMKSHAQGWIIGIAQADFSSSTNKTVQQRVTSNDGKKVTASIKEIPLLMSVSYYNPNYSESKSSNPIIGALEAVAGRTVSTDRALLVLAIFAVSLILLVSMVFSAVRNSLLSIGRNPRAEVKITRTLVIILGAALLGIAITLFVIRTILVGGV
jgi:hypothetical protein